MRTDYIDNAFSTLRRNFPCVKAERESAADERLFIPCSQKTNTFDTLTSISIEQGAPETPEYKGEVQGTARR